MTHPDWPRWMVESFNQYFAGFFSIPLFHEGEFRDTNTKPEFLELRYDGPQILEEAKGQFKLTMDVNILIQAQIREDLYAIDRLTGLVRSSFVNSIPIYKLGAGIGDDGSLLDCAQLTNKPPEVHKFGQVEPRNLLQMASVEATYFIRLFN